jgi:hypothetical protein
VPFWNYFTDFQVVHEKPFFQNLFPRNFLTLSGQDRTGLGRQEFLQTSFTLQSENKQILCDRKLGMSGDFLFILVDKLTNQ